MIRRPPRSTRTDTLFPTRRSSDLDMALAVERDDTPAWQRHDVVEAVPGLYKINRSSRSEEHTSELQSLMRISYAVFCLKKKTNNTCTNTCNLHETLSTDTIIPRTIIQHQQDRRGISKYRSK